MPLLDQIQKDMVAAMKAKDESRLSAIRMLKAALQKFQIDSMKPLDEATEMQVVTTIAKQRRESMEMFRANGRPELADKEAAELVLVEAYLPAAPSEEEVNAAIEAAVAETGVTDKAKMGLVMNAAKAKLAGKRVDGKALSEKIRARLSL
ncbi:MAG: GatB/YqeY domain-containing protein [Bryobacterales bacterium]|nr:GatB/YqeY domain-containing protein [Bryobacterales bacterium]